MVTLPKKDVDLFFKLYSALLFYANKKSRVVKGPKSPEEILNIPVEEVTKIRDKMYQNPEVIDDFVKENPFSLTEDELNIIHNWRHFVKGKFYILKSLKKYTIFMNAEGATRVYGVLALNSPIEDIVGARLPIMIGTVLLPFKDKIIYDGLINYYSIYFGGGIRRALNDEYQKVKNTIGIITSLPISGEEKEISDADRLRFYLKNERNRDRYQDEILELIEKSPELRRLYHQEMGKVNARSYGRSLRRAGITKGWFAILEGMIIAGGTTKADVERAVEGLVPVDKRDYVYMFQLKPGGRGKSG